MSYGAGGSWVGLKTTVDSDRVRWRVWIRERVGASKWDGGATGWFSELYPVMLYFEAFINMSGANPYIIYSVYNDPEYTDLNVTRTHIFYIATGPFRYVQILAGTAQATTGSIWYDVYTFLESQIEIPDTTWTVTDENGTTVCSGLENYDDALGCVEEELGADPEDPNPPGGGWAETGPFTRFRTRFYILLMGFGLLFGPMVYFAMRRPSGYEFVIGLFIMLVGYSFLRAAAGI